jgi:hypothetical protein
MSSQKNRFQGAVSFIVAAISVFAIMPFFSSVANAAVTPATNPTLSGTCGWDIALVLDNSGSIGPDLSLMKNDFIDFINNLIPSTPNEFSVTYFNAAAHIAQGFTNSTADTATAINSVTDSKSSTNWESGLTAALSTLPNRSNPNLVIFASDGEPNKYGNNQGSGNGFVQAALDAAVTEANTIKNSGTRIITIGIGLVADGENHLKAISSDDAYYSAENYNQLLSTLNQIATDLCGGAILECTPNTETRIYSTGMDGVCASVTQVCTSAGVWPTYIAPTPGSLNCSNSLDNNCNGIIDANEQFCQSGASYYCGDGNCNTNETCSTCPGDCGSCGNGGGGGGGTTYAYCGDGSCNNGEACSTCPQDCGVCASSGAGGGSAVSLYIFNEKIDSSDIGSNNVTITWDTNETATSRVVYGAYDESHTYNMTLANYGYANTNSEDKTKATSHSMTINGLRPGTVYYLRAVSVSVTEPAVSKELTFVTKSVAGVTTQTAPQEEAEDLSAQNQGSLEPEVAGAQDTNPNQEQIQEAGFLASVGNFLKFNIWLLFALVALLYLWFLIIKNRKTAEEK